METAVEAWMEEAGDWDAESQIEISPSDLNFAVGARGRLSPSSASMVDVVVVCDDDRVELILDVFAELDRVSKSFDSGLAFVVVVVDVALADAATLPPFFVDVVVESDGVDLFK